MANKRLTLKYWNSLSEGSKRRALTFVFPTMPGLVDMMVNERPDKDNPFWSIAFRKISIPSDYDHYKTCVNQTYIP